MSRTLILLIALVFTLALAIPAMAEVDVYANIYKDKDVIVVEEITKDKNVDIDVEVDVELVNAEEAMAIVNQTNGSNLVDELGIFKSDIILDSILGNVGITLLNQSSGNMNNQGNVVSAAVGQNGFAEAQASVEQDDSLIPPDNGQPPPEAKNIVLSTGVGRSDNMISSIMGNIGITAVNQSCGNMNSQANVIALAAGLNGAKVVLSEADLGQAVMGNYVYEYEVDKGDYISDSINYNHGITAVNQSSGNMNQQANVISIAGTHP